jgi:hypothetical protein
MFLSPLTIIKACNCWARHVAAKHAEPKPGGQSLFFNLVSAAEVRLLLGEA